MDMSAAQRLVWANKVAHGFNTTDVPLEFNLLMRELAEAFTAWYEGNKPALGAELADVVIFAMSLAEMAGLDLGVEVASKMAVNEGRAYRRLPNGVLVRVEEGAS